MPELSRDPFRLLFTEHPLPMWVYDADTLAFLDVNDAAQQRYGYTRDEFRAMRITDIRPPEDVDDLINFLGHRADKWFVAGGWRHRDKQGRVIDVDITSYPLEYDGRRAMLIIAQDVTERRSLETQLRQSQKMEALGRLASGVAHDFNNVLTAILGYSSLLLDGDADAATTQAQLRQIHKAAERARSLTAQLLSFSRRQHVEPRLIEVNALLDDTAHMLRRLVGESIETVVKLGPAAGWVKADPGELVQVLTNLMVNARDAMPDGGRVTIETAAVEIDEAYARSHVEATPGAYVMIAVHDTGVGMPSEVAERIFEPFYTTKEAGKGTGLGLSTLYGIVRQRRGHVQVYSEVGRGTLFRIYLPRVSAEEAADEPEPKLPAVALAAGSSVRVLVVEDDDEVRALVRDTLLRRQYAVLVAASPHEAMRLVAQHGASIGLLITDVVMPRVNGVQLADQITTMLPHIRVIYMSGFLDEVQGMDRLMRAGAAFLQKPFTVAQLDQAVYQQLQSV